MNVIEQIYELNSASKKETHAEEHQWKLEHVMDEKTERFKKSTDEYINNFQYMDGDFNRRENSKAEEYKQSEFYIRDKENAYLRRLKDKYSKCKTFKEKMPYYKFMYYQKPLMEFTGKFTEKITGKKVRLYDFLPEQEKNAIS